LVVLLHGAGGTAEDGLRLLLRQADRHGLMLYAPSSVGPTWDVIRGGFGPDVRRIQQALSEIRAPGNVAVGGFSDGASYALSLGLANGDVFDAVLAFSPGFAAPALQVGRPDIFVSHGRADRVLPIERCSRRLVPALRRAGYDVHYHEFDGGHVVPEPVVEDALDRLARAANSSGTPEGRR
jgi:phospholipase/carboxylesterase